MKTKFIIPVIILFVMGSAYRFIQLNKNIDNEAKYEEINDNESFNINGVKFQLVKSKYINDSILEVNIQLNKVGEIKDNVFDKDFPEYYDGLILVNITDKNNNLMENYTSDTDIFVDDNKKFMDIIEGKRPLGKEKENLILKFQLDDIDKETSKKIKNGSYIAKLVFPCDESYKKSKFITIK